MAEMTLEQVRSNMRDAMNSVLKDDTRRIVVDWYNAIDAVIKQREQDAKDTARYRWLLKNSHMFSSPECDGLQLPITFSSLNDFDLTKAIDAAMAKESGNG